MSLYNLILPVEVEFLSPLNSFASSLDMAVNYSAEAKIGTISIVTKIQDKNGTISLENISANSENNAINIAIQIFNTATNLIALDIHLQNKNPHYGHPRIGWDVSKVTIAPRDSFMSEDVRTKMISEMKPRLFTGSIENAYSKKQIQSILSSISASFLSVDYRTKFYNAFTVFEYLESNYTDKIKTTPLLTEAEVSALEKAIEETIRNQNPDSIRRVTSSFRDAVSKLTHENRATKLRAILNDLLKITQVNYASEMKPVDYDVCKKLIEMRNGLFHGKTALTDRYMVDKDFKIYTDIAIIVAALSVEILLQEK